MNSDDDEEAEAEAKDKAGEYLKVKEQEGYLLYASQIALLLFEELALLRIAR